jgi:hypothetical protein
VNDGPIAMPLRLTAIALLLRPMGPWYVRPAILALATIVLVSSRALRWAPLWGVLTLLVAARIASDWPLADNHIYLLSYWSLGTALALGTTDPHAALAECSRWLLGLAFAFAVLWKGALSPDYLDGRFFRVTLLTDPRFEDAAMLFGKLTPQTLEANRHALDVLPEGAALLNPPPVVETPRLRLMATVSTWGALLLEVSVAATMLLPGAPAIAVARHITLLGFCLVTYAFAPVAGFGWVLTVLGLTQCRPGQRALKACYLGMFLLVLFYSEVPWANLLRMPG